MRSLGWRTASCALALAAATAQAQSVDHNFPVVNGPVHTVAFEDGSTTDFLYVGGNFTYAGPNTGGAGMIDEVSGARNAAFPRVDGTIHAIVRAPAGGWFIGGDFDQIGGNGTIQNLAHVAANGAVTQWAPNPNGTVRALLVQGNNLFVAGEFGQIGGQARSRLASLSATTSSVSVNVFTANMNNTVRALASDGAVLYAGGDFTAVGAVARDFAAQLNLNSGAVNAWNPDPNGAVHALAIMAGGTDVFLGGAFTALGNSNRNRVGKVANDGDVKAWTCNANNVVRAFAMDDNFIFIGGDFNTIGGVTRKAVAKVENSGSNPLVKSWNAKAQDASGAAASVRCLVLVPGTRLIAGGTFVQLGSEPRNRIGSVGVSDATDHATTWDPNAGSPVGTGISVDAMALSAADDDLYVGGTFTSIGGVNRVDLAKFNLTTKAVDTGWSAGLPGDSGYEVFALEVAQGVGLYVGGTFSIPGQLRSSLVRVSLSNGALDTGWSANVTTGFTRGTVRALCRVGGVLYAAGDFQAIKGTARNHIGAVTESGSGTVTEWNPSGGGPVYDLLYGAEGPGMMYLGGGFTSVQGVTRRGAAKVALAGTGALQAWNPDLRGGSIAYALERSASGSAASIIIGGDFSQPFGPSHLGEVDTTNGTFSSWRAHVPGGGGNDPNAPVHALFRASSGGSTYLYVAGTFTQIGVASTPLMARLVDDPYATDRGRVSSWAVGFIGSAVRTLHLQESASTVFFGGTLSRIGVVSRDNVGAVGQ